MSDTLQSQSEDIQKNISKYLDSLSIEHKEICNRLRSLIITCMPGATEMIVHGAIAYATSLSSVHRIVYIAPQKKWVNLGFFFGADIADPSGLLEGDGKRMRHIKLCNEDEVNNPAIACILKTAWMKATADIMGMGRQKNNLNTSDQKRQKVKSKRP